MASITVDIDDEACAEVMRRFAFTTRSEAVNYALRALATRRAPLEEVHDLQGIGWDGDLDEMRSNRCS